MPTLTTRIWPKGHDSSSAVQSSGVPPPFTSRSKNQSNSAKSEARVDQSTCAVPNPLAQGPHVGTLPVRIRYCLDAPPESVAKEADRDQTKQDSTEGASCNDFQGTVLPGGAPAGAERRARR